MCARAQRREGVPALIFACRFGKRKGVFHVHWRPHSPVPRRLSLRADARRRRLHRFLQRRPLAIRDRRDVLKALSADRFYEATNPYFSTGWWIRIS